METEPKSDSLPDLDTLPDLDIQPKPGADPAPERDPRLELRAGPVENPPPSPEDDFDLKYDPYTELKSELESGEILVWAGKPKSGFVLREIDFYLIPFSLVFFGLSVLWMLAASGALWSADGEPNVTLFNFTFSLAGLPFVLFGFYLFCGRFYLDRKQREKTTYGLSNQRVIIKSGLSSSMVRTINLESITDMTLKLHDDKSGTITFGHVHPLSPIFQGLNWWPGGSAYQSPSFEEIPHARRIFEVIRGQQAYSIFKDRKAVPPSQFPGAGAKVAQAVNDQRSGADRWKSEAGTPPYVV